MTKQSPLVKIKKKQVSRKVSLANKRLRRLKKNNLHHLPAYQNWKKYHGGEKFSVAGKNTLRELQKEETRLNHFINAKTSTVRGSNKTLKTIAKKTNTSYEHVSELPSKLSSFFDTSSKVGQYLRVKGASGAIGYQYIWKHISVYDSGLTSGQNGAMNSALDDAGWGELEEVNPDQHKVSTIGDKIIKDHNKQQRNNNRDIWKTLK